MKQMYVQFAVLACIALLAVPAISFGFGVDLPYADGFETNSAGEMSAWGKWTLSGSNPVIQTSYKMAGTYGCYITNKSALALNADTNANDYTNVWVRFYVKPNAASSEPNVSSNDTGAFYLSTAGVLRAYIDMGASNGWSNLVTGLPTNSWLGFGIHVDYRAGQWDLYYSTDGYETIMSRANAASMGFHTNAVWTNEFEFISVSNNAYVDGFALAVGSDACGVSLTNVYTAERSYNAWTLSGRPPRAYTSDQAQMDSTLGTDLKQGLDDNDQVRVYTNNGGTGGWNIYTLSGGSWDYSEGDQNLVIGPTQGFWLRRTNSTSTAIVAFYPNSVEPSLSDVSLGNGWNLVAWPYLTTKQVNSGTSWGFSGANDGDKIYLLDDTLYTRLRSSSGTWYDGASSSSYEIKPYQGFWYRNLSGGTETWAVQNAK
ncbi:MAG: hypothetical protein R6V03_11080 [Kiritimatiellia bacterium]